MEKEEQVIEYQWRQIALLQSVTGTIAAPVTGITQDTPSLESKLPELAKQLGTITGAGEVRIALINENGEKTLVSHPRSLSPLTNAEIWEGEIGPKKLRFSIDCDRQVLGSLALEKPNKDQFTADDRQLAQTVTNLLIIALALQLRKELPEAHSTAGQP